MSDFDTEEQLSDAQAEIERLRAERDEAREAAKQVVKHSSVVNWAKEKWPWIKE